MVVVESLQFLQVALSVLHVAHTAVAESEHILAVDEVLRVERIVPDEQVGQRNGEVVHDLLLEDVLLSVVDETIEATVSLPFATELAERESLIEDLVGLGIVVVHGSSRFLRSTGGLFPALTRLLVLTKGFVSHTEEVVEVVLLCAI